MKILVLMPLDEKNVYIASAVYQCLEPYAKDRCFCMPFFMQYLITTKIAPNWTYSLFDTMASAERLYELAEREKDNIIIFGNMPKRYKFDAVFSLQDLEEDLDYSDKFLEKMQELADGDKKLEEKVKDTYGVEDVIMPLHNKVAAADFLSAYLKTDPHLDKIEKEYKERVGGNKTSK